MPNPLAQHELNGSDCPARTPVMGSRVLILVLAAGAAGTLAATTALAQQTEPAPPAPVKSISEPRPNASANFNTAHRGSLDSRLWKPITAEFKEQRVDDVLAYVTQVSGLELEPFWTNDKEPVGLAADTLVSFKANSTPALRVIERVLDAVGKDAGVENAWQLTEDGTLQIGPKDRLNAFKRTEVYDISDLTLELKDFVDAPTFDIQQSGATAVPFTAAGQQDQPARSKQERGQEIVDFVRQNVEPAQWTDSGGTGGTITLHRTTMVVTAPEYIHRQIDGNGRGKSTTLKIHIPAAPRSANITAAKPAATKTASTKTAPNKPSATPAAATPSTLTPDATAKPATESKSQPDSR